MATSFVGSTTNSAINGGNVTLDLTLISGLAQNDIVIVSYAIGTLGNNYDMAMVTAGYTEVADLFSTEKANLGVFYKFMGASPDTSAVATGSGNAADSTSAVVMAFRGVNTTTPMDVAAATATGGGTFNPNPPSIDWSTSGTWTVIAGASGTAMDGNPTYTFPAGYTTNAIYRFSDDNIDCMVGMGYKISPADPEDPAVITHSGADNGGWDWCAVTMALREAGAGAAGFTNVIVVGI